MGEFNQAKYVQKYQKENYDRMIFNVPKGHKAIIEAHWKSKGYKSLNAYVNELIRRDMNENGEKSSKTVNIGNDNNGIINM